jgi:hypothetical protein
VNRKVIAAMLGRWAGGYGWKAAQIGSGREWLMAPEHGRRGRLHLLLGAAPCAGKTYALLAEGRRLAASGSDVVVGVADVLECVDPMAAMAVGLADRDDLDGIRC